MPTTIPSGTSWPRFRRTSSATSSAENISAAPPIAVRIDSDNPLELAVFLATARSYIEQTSPGLTNWDALKYKEQGYINRSPVKGKNSVPQEMENLAIYYTTVGGAWPRARSANGCCSRRSIALSENPPKGMPMKTPRPRPSRPNRRGHRGTQYSGSGWVVARLERGLARQPPDPGDCQCLGPRAIPAADAGPQCWNNLPILNEWKRLYPDRNPVAVQRQGLGRDLRLPWRRKVRLEREVRDDGIDRLRPLRRDERRPLGPGRA